LNFHFALLALIEIGNLFVAEFFFLSFNLMGCGRGILFGNSRRSQNSEFKNNVENYRKIFSKKLIQKTPLKIHVRSTFQASVDLVTNMSSK
jgi:hypothetical protein